jgi:O-antigen/teichoic acid export membrane protein
MFLRTLARDSAIYGSADLFSKALAFLTFPLIAAALSPLAFGALELVLTATALLGMAANCGLNNSLQRFYWDVDTVERQRPVLVSSGFAALALLLLVAVAVGGIVAATITPWLPSWNLPVTWIGLIGALALMTGTQLVQYLLDVIRVRGKPWRFIVVSLASRVLTACAGLIAVVWFGWGLDGLLVVQAVVALLALPMAALAVRRDLTAAIDRVVAQKLVHFGYPFIYSGIAFWLFGSMDRWMLAAMSSVEEVGIYSVAFRFASIVMFVSLAFGQAWSPLALKVRTDHPSSYRALYADVLLVVACGMLLVGGFVALFSGELIDLVMPAEYRAVALPLAVLCLGVVVQSTIQITAIGISLEKKTYLFARLSWIAAGANLLFNLLLIPSFGALGAAWATTLTYLLLTGTYLYYTQLLHPMPLPWRRVAIWLAMLVCIAVVSNGWAGSPETSLTVGFKFLFLIVCVVVCSVLAPWRRSTHVG